MIKSQTALLKIQTKHPGAWELGVASRYRTLLLKNLQSCMPSTPCKVFRTSNHVSSFVEFALEAFSQAPWSFAWKYSELYNKENFGCAATILLRAEETMCPHRIEFWAIPVASRKCSLLKVLTWRNSQTLRLPVAPPRCLVTRRFSVFNTQS